MARITLDEEHIAEILADYLQEKYKETVNPTEILFDLNGGKVEAIAYV